MTWCERIGALIDSVRHVSAARLPGCIVECGVWRGGSMMVAAQVLLEAGDIRDLYLIDTYSGMTPPTDSDVDYLGVSAVHEFRTAQSDDHVEWCYAGLDDVRRDVLSTGNPEDRLHFIEGDVMQALPCADICDIALLRLDTDWYESTLHELKQHYPKLILGGILIVDDYGYLRGCKKAVDEYFGPNGPFRCALDDTGRLIIKAK